MAIWISKAFEKIWIFWKMMVLCDFSPIFALWAKYAENDDFECILGTLHGSHMHIYGSLLFKICSNPLENLQNIQFWWLFEYLRRLRKFEFLWKMTILTIFPTPPLTEFRRFFAFFQGSDPAKSSNMKYCMSLHS